MATSDNLQAAFAGESQANRKYLAFAKKADEDGFPQWSVEAIVSRDNGETWDMAHRYVLAKWSGMSHVQSTSTILLPNGSSLTAFGAGYRIRRLKEPQPWLGPLDVGLVRWRPALDGATSTK